MACVIVRSNTLRVRRTAATFITMSLLIINVLLLAGNAYGQTFQSVGPIYYGDDLNSAKLNPYPAIPVSTIAFPPGQCSWINTGLNNFIAANPATGKGPSGQEWSYSWAGVATEAKVEAGINILSYYPYVVTAPKVTGANGVSIRGAGPGELGGAVINLSYTPTLQNGAPDLTNLHWIQAYTGTRRGTPFGAILDNDPFQPYTGQSSVSPFYDTSYFAGTYGTNNAYFADRPIVFENEYELNPVASVQFQVVLATDTVTDVNGVTQNALTLYGGEWWGFTYSATDVPEPGTYALLGSLGLTGGTFLRRRRTR